MSNTSPNPYIQAISRFRLIVLAGLGIAISAPILMLYKVAEPGPPPRFIARDQYYYATETQILVDSPKGPYLRTTQREVLTPSSVGTSTAQAPTLVPTVEPRTIIDAANLFPALMTSDEIAMRRAKKIGSVVGSVSAKAIYAFAGNNRFRPSRLPIIQIGAIAPSPKNATLLAQGTFEAFNGWLGEEQRRARIPPSERIVLKQLNAPTTTTQLGGPSFGVPILTAIAIFSAFCGLAVFLDRLRPVKGRLATISDDLVTRMPPSGTQIPRDESADASATNGRLGAGDPASAQVAGRSH